MLLALTSFDQWINTFFASLGWPGEGVARLLLAIIAGGVVGLEREARVKHAGFRTLMLVCVGSALVMIVSERLAYADWPQLHGNNRVQVDPGRIAYGIMTGVGFLGAGTIIERRTHAKGLTTAAAIWCVAAIGMAMGFGLYTLGTVTTLFVLAALWLLSYFEEWIPRQRSREVVVRTAYRPTTVRDAVARFTQLGLYVADTDLRRSDDLRTCDVTLRIAYRDAADYLALESKIEEDGTYHLISSKET